MEQQILSNYFIPLKYFDTFFSNHTAKLFHQNDLFNKDEGRKMAVFKSNLKDQKKGNTAIFLAVKIIFSCE